MKSVGTARPMESDPGDRRSPKQGRKMSPEEKIKDIEKKITMVGIIDMPGSIMLGLGLYAKFNAKGDVFHPLLKNQDVVDSMLVIGAIIVVIGGYKAFTLARDRARIQRENNL